MYVQHKIEVRSCYHYRSGKGIRVTYYECVFVVLGTYSEMRMRRIVIYGVSGSTIFFLHCLINGTIFERKVIEHKNACCDSLRKFCLKHFSL
jgi:hypothetical protein